MRRPLALVLLLLTFRSAAADDQLAAMLEKVKPSVVHLAVESDAGVATGSGFVVGDDMIVTNHHVVDGCRTLIVKFHGGAFAVAKGVLHLDKAKDIAVVRVATRPELMKSLAVRKSLPKPGQDVVALGNPQELEFSVTRGIVSGIRSPDELNPVSSLPTLAGTWIQTDAAISPGNSGGPLVDDHGEVVGMSTFYRRDGQNLNFAISCIDILDAIAAAKKAEVKEFAKTPIPMANAEGDGSLPEVLKPVRDLALRQIQSALPHATAEQMSDALQGRITGFYTATTAANVTQGMVTRIRGSATVIQILEDRMLLTIDGVKFEFPLLGVDGGELSAKWGDGVVKNVNIDDVFYIGKAQAYTTVANATSYYIPLYQVAGLLEMEDIKGLIDAEISRRRVEATAAEKARQEERLRREAEATAAEAARQEAAIQSYISRVRKTLSDTTGKFSVDAAVVELRDDAIVLVRLDDGRVIDVPIARLSDADQEWIQDNRSWVRMYGSLVRSHLIGGASSAAKAIAQLNRAKAQLAGNPDSARRLLDDLMREFPGTILAQEAESVLRGSQLEQLTTAIGQYNAIIQRQPDNAEAYLGRGQVFVGLGKTDYAIGDFTEAIRLNPKLSKAYVQRGLLYDSTGRFNEAISDATKAIEIGMSDTLGMAYYVRGSAQYSNGQYTGAIQDCGKAIELGVTEPYVFIWRGYSYLGLDRIAEGEADFATAIGLAPKMADAYIGRASARWERDDYRGAVADMQSAIQLDASDPTSHNGMAWYLATCPDASVRNADKALLHAKKACELTEWKEAFYFDTLAAAFAEGEDFAQALIWQEKAVAGGDVFPEDTLKECRLRLEMYKKRQPYREK